MPEGLPPSDYKDIIVGNNGIYEDDGRTPTVFDHSDLVDVQAGRAAVTAVTEQNFRGAFPLTPPRRLPKPQKVSTPRSNRPALPVCPPVVARIPFGRTAHAVCTDWRSALFAGLIVAAASSCEAKRSINHNLGGCSTVPFSVRD